MPAKRRAAAPPLADRIVDTALDMAEERGWGGVRLHAVADTLGVSLAEVRVHYRDLDAVADAWLLRADHAMLAPAPAGFASLPARERIFLVIARWLAALAAHRSVTAEIFGAKLYLGHPHHNLKLITWTSRTVQWIREAALLDGTGRRKQVEEVGLTSLFLLTLAQWTRDDSDGQHRTFDLLQQRLARADGLMARLFPPPD